MPNFPVFQNSVAVDTDASQAKIACSVGHVCKRRIEKLAQCSKLTHLCVLNFSKLIYNELQNLQQKCNRLKELTTTIEIIVNLLTHKLKCVELLTDCQSANEDLKREFEILHKEFTSGLQPAVESLHQRYVTESFLSREWETSTKGVKCPSNTKAPNRAKTLIDRLRESWQHLLRDRATRSLSYNDEQFHVLERIKVEETGRRVRTLLERECVPIVTTLSDNLADWYKMSQTVYLQTMILDKDVDIFESGLESLIERIKIVKPYIEGKLLNAVNKVKNEHKVVEGGGKSNLNKYLYSLSMTEDEISQILLENNNFIDKIVDLFKK